MNKAYSYNTIVNIETGEKVKKFVLVEALNRAPETELMLLSIACDKAVYTKMTSDKAAAFDLLNDIVGAVR
jgi:hypothetical protein